MTTFSPQLVKEDWKYFNLDNFKKTFENNDNISSLLPPKNAIILPAIQGLPEGISFTSGTTSHHIDTKNETNPNVIENIAKTTPLHLDINSVINQPIWIELAQNENYTHLHISAQKNSEATIVIQSAAHSYFVPLITGHFFDNSKITLVIIQQDQENTLRLESQRFVLEENVDFKSFYLISKNATTRRDIQVTFLGSKSHTDLYGLAILEEKQELHTHTKLVHTVPNTTASQHFKSILKDRSKNEFQGLVHVKAEAQETDSNQYNHTLNLSDFARALSRPQLEIFADNVRCSHGATIGQLDEEHLFYLRSRGYTLNDARNILLEGFCQEITDALPDALKDYLLGEYSALFLPSGKLK